MHNTQYPIPYSFYFIDIILVFIYKLIRIYNLFTFLAFNVHFYHLSFLVRERLQELFLMIEKDIYANIKMSMYKL